MSWHTKYFPHLDIFKISPTLDIFVLPKRGFLWKQIQPKKELQNGNDSLVFCVITKQAVESL